jgi:hypothetical protein
MTTPPVPGSPDVPQVPDGVPLPEGFQVPAGPPPPSLGFPQTPMMGRPRRRRRLFVGVGGVVTVLVVIGIKLALGFGISTAVHTVVQGRDDAHQTAVGECAKVSGTTDHPNYSKVNCGSGQENYTVGAVLGSSSDTCPDIGYDEYYEQGTLNNVKLCLAPVFLDGKCYQLTQAANQMGYPEVACNTPNAAIAKVIKGQADASLCPSGQSNSLVYPTLNRTYCLGPPTGN